MTKVIETNVSLKDNEIVDFQSRVIEVSSWNDYVNEIGNGEFKIRTSIIGSLHGNSVPRNSKVENFTYDEKTLKCDIYNYHGLHTKKLAYLAEVDNEIVFENGSIIKFIKSEDSIRGKGWFAENEELFQREYDCVFVGESDKE